MTGGARVRRLALVLAALAAAGGAARAEEDVPRVISPLRIESDHEGVNLTNGRTAMEPPALAVPAAPNLRFDRIQNAAPYVKGNVQTPPGAEIDQRRYTIHTGTGASDSFHCDNYVCASVTGTGSSFLVAGRRYRQAGSAALWTFSLLHSQAPSPNQTMMYYASSVAYPNGEVITYSYDSVQPPGDVLARTWHRPNRIESNLGYFIAIAYQSDIFNTDGWGSPHVVTLASIAAPAIPLGRLTYSGSTITDLGGRVYTCTGCSNALGFDIEAAEGSMQLPGDAAPLRQVAPVANLPQSAARPVGSVIQDGIPWSYGYDNPRGQSGALQSLAYGYLFDRVTVTGPNGIHAVYDVAQRHIPMTSTEQNVITRVTDALGRSTSYEFDSSYRVTRIVFPELNRVDVGYDEYGNITQRIATPRPNLGQPIVETAQYPGAGCVDALCWRPLWTLDARQQRTDYAYNAAGQLTERIDPADAGGVRRRTSILYALSPHGISRRSAVRVCADTGASCGASAPIQTEYDYLPDSDLLLPIAERRIDVAHNLTLTTRYTYDLAGRLLSTDGPMAGSDDTSHNRYDVHGRLAGTIGADPDPGSSPGQASGPLPRLAVRNSYDGADRLVRVETGTLAALPPADVAPADWPGFTILRTLETAYAPGTGRKTRDTLREGAAGPVRSFTQYSYDALGRLECTALRMNPALYGSLPASACTPGPAGSDGPDRIARNVYDAAGQRLQLREGVGTPDEAAVASWEYNANGQVSAVIDGNGNRAELHYDGHGRQDRWTFPSASGPAGSVDPNDYEAYGYDPAGNRTSLRKRDGSVLTYEYDALGRLIVKRVPERSGLAPAQTRDVHYGYDLRGLQLYARFDGPSGPGIANSYDAFGRLATTTADSDGTARTLAYKYDAASLRARIVHPDLAWFETSRDTLGRPFWLASSDNDACFYGSWRADGLPGSQGRCNDASTWVSRDSIGRLDGLGHYYGHGGTGDVTWLYQHNPASQIRTVTRDNDAYAWTRHYAVNRGYTTNGLNQYVSAGGGTFTYDANGNLASEPAPNGGRTSYTYDVENRLVGSSTGVALAYDPLGRLFQVTAANGTVTRFLYDGDALVAEYNAAGEMTRRYVHWEGADVPVVSYETGSLANPSYLHADHQGSIVAVSDATGVTQINRYDEYGIPGAGNAGRFQYTGQVWLAELGLYYYKARLYSPTLGRFLQVDPIGYDDQFNLYVYVGNDPVNLTDPDGRQSLQGEAVRDAGRQVVDYVVWVADDLVDLGRGIVQGRFEWAFGGLPPTLGGGVFSEVAIVPRAISAGHTAARGEMAASAARAEASAATAEGRAGGAVSGLVTREGRTFTGRSTAAGGPGRATNARVQEAVERAPQGRYPGCCAEVNAVSQAANAGANLRGSSIVTMRTTTERLMTPCPTCRSVLRHFGIRH